MEIIRKCKEIKIVFQNKDKKQTIKKMIDIGKNWDATAIDIRF